MKHLYILILLYIYTENNKKNSRFHRNWKPTRDQAAHDKPVSYSEGQRWERTAA